MNEQFVTIPNDVLKHDGLSIRDMVTYAYLKKHYNNIIKEAFPSLDTLSRESGISKPTIAQCIQHLDNAGYIKIHKVGKMNHYTFSESKKFEIYSFDFLDDPNLSVYDKAYMIRMQPEMIKNQQLGIGKITYSELEIADKLHIDLRTLRKYENHLQEGNHPIMTLIPTNKVDPNTGLVVQERVFDFDAYNNLIALKFYQVDEELKDKATKDDFQRLEKKYKEQSDKLEKIVKYLENQGVSIDNIENAIIL